ncbi:hypothetical protein PAECIP111890_03328 [Paenibacillus sp. JJ-223]|nr:hypothetical protein PAECIP111890_03328 [Paenibacillus sp. JJ-223]
MLNENQIVKDIRNALKSNQFDNIQVMFENLSLSKEGRSV